MAQDWKDALAALGGSLPAGDDSVPEVQAPGDDKTKGNKGTLHVLLDKKGRKGKTATIIEGFEEDDAAVEELASELKRKIGTGGSARGGEILLQGDWREKAASLLKERGYKVKGI